MTLSRTAVFAVLFSLAAGARAASAKAAPGADDGSVAHPEDPKARPFTVYPGAKLSKEKTEEYRDERGLDTAWAYLIKAPLEKVTAFYKPQFSEPTAESESDDLYFATNNSLELRISRLDKGKVLIEFGRKSGGPSDPDLKQGANPASDGGGDQPGGSEPYGPAPSRRPAAPVSSGEEEETQGPDQRSRSMPYSGSH